MLWSRNWICSSETYLIVPIILTQRMALLNRMIQQIYQLSKALLDGTSSVGNYTPSSVTLPGTTSTVTVENGDYFHGLVLLDNGDVDVYRHVDYFIGTDDDDTFIGGSGSDQFNAMFSR